LTIESKLAAVKSITSESSVAKTPETIARNKPDKSERRMRSFRWPEDELEISTWQRWLRLKT
jgi:hypothetical protein